jgi:hypothetical protein
MSHSTKAITNKQQKEPKEFFEQYLYNSGEPSDDNNFQISAELEAELLENSYFMKRRIRRLAHRMRNRYS